MQFIVVAGLAVALMAMVAPGTVSAAEAVTGAGSRPDASELVRLPRIAPMPRPAPLQATVAGPGDPFPRARDNALPRARWEHRRDGDLWTRVALSAVETHGEPLLSMVPEDIADWCPAYPDQDRASRAAFWAALVSTLSRYESTWDPQAVGGGGLWHGLTQILPTTAELRGCRARTGAALRHGPSNISCAIRIMSITVPRDNAISIRGERRWQGVAADWGPMTTGWMRRDMQRYTRKQTYCRPLGGVEPRPRPETLASNG